MRVRFPRRVADKRAAMRAKREVRSEFFHHARAHTPIVAVDYEGMRFLVSTADVGLGLRFFAKRRRRDAETLRRALAHLDAGGGLGSTRESASSSTSAPT